MAGKLSIEQYNYVAVSLLQIDFERQPLLLTTNQFLQFDTLETKLRIPVYYLMMRVKSR